MIATQNFRPAPFPRLFGLPGLIALAALYLLAGVAGHDPWRGDDATHFGPVLGMLQGEGLLFPRIAGEAAMQYPPLYYWTATLLAQTLGWLLPAQDGARFASALFTGLTLYWTAQAAGRLYGLSARAPAVLLTLGTLGLLIHAHLTQPILALLAMQALTLAGLARVPHAPLAGALQAALGAALAFLAAGLAGMLLTLPLFVLVLVCAPDCRTPRASGALLLGVCLALLLGMLWPLALHYQQPELFRLWWAEHWGGFGNAMLTRGETAKLLEESGWFLWPLWPIALWSLWNARRRLTCLPIMLPLIASLLTAAWMIVDPRELPAGLLPMIPPLTLLAAAGAPHLRRGAANAFDWFGVLTLGFFALLIWLGWTAQVFAWPPGLARHVERYGTGFVLHGQTTQAVLGLVLMAAWLLLVWRIPRGPHRGPANWALGTTLLWCLAVLLLMPWFDHDRSYRAPAESLAQLLADEHPGCIAAIGLTDDVRVSLDYFAGLRPELVADPASSPCKFLLVHDERRAEPRKLPDMWQPVWEHRRGGGRQLDIFRLYRRD